MFRRTLKKLRERSLFLCDCVTQARKRSRKLACRKYTLVHHNSMRMATAKSTIETCTSSDLMAFLYALPLCTLHICDGVVAVHKKVLVTTNVISVWNEG
mmetsp:Transcript_2385/g.4013  ORF Transcript_2385/g.4013 Transcript_2385/m.4013 type:complete len:99 (+) Transcript_2385:47-343(+)